MKAHSLSKADWLSCLLCLVAIIPGLAVYDSLPDSMAIHFDIHGVPNQFASKPFAIIAVPVIMALFQLLISFLINVLKKEKLQNGIHTFIRCFIPALTFIVQSLNILFSLNMIGDIPTVALVILSIIAIIGGNYIPKLRQNRFAGIRTRHTLENAELWHKTHRFAGFVFTFGGVITLILSLMGLAIAALVVLSVLVFIPLLYSEITYQKMERNKSL